MVSPTQATQMARALPKQQIDKVQVWTTFIGGAMFLFLGTIAIENNPAFFPAISRANQASTEARKAAEVRKASHQRFKIDHRHPSI